MLVWSARHPRLALVLAFCLAALAGSGAVRLRFETSLEALFRDRGGEFQKYRDFEANFGSGGRIFVVASGARLFHPSELAWLRDFDEKLAGLRGVTSVESVFRLSRMGRVGQWLHPQALVTRLPESIADGEELRTRILADRRVPGNLAASDGSALCFIVELGKDPGAARKVVDFRAAMAASAPPGVELFAAGAPLIFGETQDILRGDGFKLAGAFLVLLSGTLLLLYRGWAGLLVPLSTVALAVAATLGIAGWMAYPVTIVLLPAFILVAVISASETVYLVSAYHESLARNHTRGEAAASLGPAMGKTLRLAAFTSAVGFATVAVAANIGLRHFAVVGAAGILANLILSSLAAPAILVLLPAPSRVRPPGWLRRSRAGLVRLPGPLRSRLGWIYILALVGIGAGIFQLRIETSFLSYLPADNPLVGSFEKFRDRFGGASYDSVIVETHRRGGVFEKDALAELEHLRDRLGTRADFVYGLPDLLEEARGELPLPIAADQIAGMIPPEILRRFVDHDGSRTRFWIRTHAPGTKEVLALDRFINDSPREKFPPGTELSLMSPGAMAAKVSDRIVRELLGSLAYLASITAAIIGLALRSLRLGLVALIPNALPLLATYGWMGWLGIEMGLGVFAVGIVAFAVSVNDTVHLLVTCERKRMLRPSAGEVAGAGLREVIVPVIVTSLTLAAGFSALLFSGLSNLRETGLLLVISSFSAMAADLLITPLLVPKRD